MLMDAAVAAMRESSYVPQEAAYVWHQHDTVPAYLQCEDSDPQFLAELASFMKSHSAQGVALRIVRKVKAEWPIPGSDKTDYSERDAAVVGIVFAGLKYPIYVASAVMDDPIRSDEDMNDPKKESATRPVLPVMSEWITVPLESIPNNFSDAPTQL